MGVKLFGYQELVAEAIRVFWNSRGQSSEAQQARGVSDVGGRSAVTSGKNMDGFIDVVKTIATMNGLPDSAVYSCRESIRSQRLVTLPGYYRPTKNWDLLIVNRGQLVAVFEFKSQVGSLGNNLNNRCEEAIGSATDLLVAFREQAFGMAPKPFMGYLMLVGDTPEARSPVSTGSTHYPVFREFNGASYAQRYEILCRKLVLERLYDAACLLLSPPHLGLTGAYSELSADTGMQRLLAGFAGHVAGLSAL